MRWAIPTSVAVHLGLIAGAWLFLQLTPADITLSEAAVSIDIISTEVAVTEPSDTVSEESVNLVSAGMTQAASEPETVDPSDAPVLERLDRAATLAELEPTPELITTASINPLATVQPVAAREPVKVANLNPMPEPIVEEVVEAPPVPAPRIVRKTVEKPTEKPVEKKQPKQVASLGNGGEAEADSAAAKAAGGTSGKVVTAGKGTIDAYEGKVRAKFLKALRKPKDAKRGEVRVIFRLDANGRVIKSKLSRSSGDDKLDQAALAAIERAAPYPPIPAGAGKSTWDITIPIGIN
jgi:protein TonB